MFAGNYTGFSRNLRMAPHRLRSKSGSINNKSFKEVPRNLLAALQTLRTFSGFFSG